MQDKSPAKAKALALRLAQDIGCSGAHKDSKGRWMPCASTEEMETISNTAETSRWRSVVPGAKEAGTKRSIGKNKRKRRSDGWENLTEAPIRGIGSLEGGGIVSSTSFGGKSALGASIGERAGGASSGSSGSGVDRDGDGVINDGTEDERPAQRKKREERRYANSKPVGKETDNQERLAEYKKRQPKKKKQTIYEGGRRNSRTLMPNGPDPKDYPADKYDLVDEDGKPYQRGKSAYDDATKTKAGQMTGPEYVRDNDPDVFMDPESARFRSRQLGCIGISRRISKTGRAVWMPCTNMTDYSNSTGSTSLGRRNMSKRREQETRNAVRTVLREKPKSSVTRKTSLTRELIGK